MRYIYATVLSTESYAVGVVALYESLKAVNAAYPFVCICSVNISRQTCNRLSAIGIQCRYLSHSALESIGVSGLNSEAYSHWRYTFDKLLLWELTEYDKIVYLDADMVVMNNTDGLFAYPDLSGVAAGEMLHSSWNRLNSGTLVIEPNQEVANMLLANIALTIQERQAIGENIGDQDVINHSFSQWITQKEKHLPEGYNLFYKHLTQYIRQFGFGYKGKDDAHTIYVVHFIGKRKPWHFNRFKSILFIVKQWLQNPYGVKAFRLYRKYVVLAQKKLSHGNK